MEETNPFVLRAEALLSGKEQPATGTERLLMQQQGMVPFTPQYHKALLAFYMWEAAGKGRDRPPSYKTDTNIVCAVCGSETYLKGWCKKHYLIARRTKSATAPFLSPSPSTGRLGRPVTNPEKHTFVVLRISVETARALDVLRESNSRSLVAETIVREALGLPPLPEATVDG